jgi:hypothetical protein
LPRLVLGHSQTGDILRVCGNDLDLHGLRMIKICSINFS